MDGLISQGVTLLCGASKIGKSWMMLKLGVQVSQGLPILGMETHKCDVLYLCLEDTFARIQDRLYRLTDEAPTNLRFAVSCRTLGSGLEEQIDGHMAAYPDTRLIIIDTLQKVRSTNPTAAKNGLYAGDYCDIAGLKSMADSYGIAIVLVHHLRKQADSDDPFNQVSGTTGIVGAADTTLVLKKLSRSSDTATLIATGRDIEYQELILRFENLEWQLVERRGETELKQEEIPPFISQLVAFLADRDSWQGSATELLAKMDTDGVTASVATKQITHFYYDALLPQGIFYERSRTSQARSLRFWKGNDSSDTNDDK